MYMNDKPNILLTNDDGVYAEGLLELRRVLPEIGNLTTIAPERPRSGCGHSVTLHKPLRLTKVKLADGKMAWSSNGTPTDCVSLGIRHLLKRQVGLMIAGINRGPNLGYDFTYSGTVASAMEAAIMGIPAIAVSLAIETEDDADYSDAAKFTVDLAKKTLERGLPSGVLLNVNVPAVPKGSIKGVKITRQGDRRYDGDIAVRKDPRGREYFWFGGDVPFSAMEEGTDMRAVADGYISVTPVHLDMTAYAVMAELEAWDL